ncbi:MAG: hypothetical protein LBK82_14850 [Planctomycetaceae bacterium]|jgi:hypothetical protein|nr:hypothetical protein [Planctomycetaceae bacterium]
MRILFLCGLLLSLFCDFGCGHKRPEGMPKSYPVSITITVDGSPLADAQLIAYPDSVELGNWFGSGITNASGTAQMKTRDIKGLIESPMILTIDKRKIVEYFPLDETGLSNIYEFYVDTEYWGKETSSLKFNVEANGEKNFIFDVKKFDTQKYDQKKFLMKLKK